MMSYIYFVLLNSWSEAKATFCCFNEPLLAIHAYRAHFDTNSVFAENSMILLRFSL
jgi:hypothetical protein